MSDHDFTALWEAAERATDYPWPWAASRAHRTGTSQERADWEHICAASPMTVLAIRDTLAARDARIAELKEENARLRAEMAEANGRAAAFAELRKAGL
jgi:uncharacterized small protein (DUF1192 family)